MAAAMDAREGCFCEFKAAPAALLQWNIYIVIKESGCEDVRCESEDEESKILRSGVMSGGGGGGQM